MSAKKWVTIVTFFCTMLAIILLPLFKYLKYDMGYDISLAVFGSALLGFIMSLVEYFTERRKAMEQFWLEARRILAQFREAKCIKFDVPEDIVVSCIVENYNNKLAQEYKLVGANCRGITESHDNQNRFIQWMTEYEGNFVVCMNKAIEISKLLFSEKRAKQNGIESVCIYQEQFDDIEESLEKFRTRIYFRAKMERIERIPVSGQIINFEDYK